MAKTDPDRVLRYKCRNKAGSHEGEEHANVLQASGCPTCGCKVLEVWDTVRGHIKIDFGGKKSRRKQKRRRQIERLTA